ncbi:hypothetical protein D3C71_1361320 [compost metagenome]
MERALSALNCVVLLMAIVTPAGSAAAPLAAQTPLVTLPGIQPVIFRSGLTTGGVPGVVTETSLPLVSKAMVEGTGREAAFIGSLPFGLRPSIKV